MAREVADRMTPTADATISALRSTHDELAATGAGRCPATPACRWTWASSPPVAAGLLSGRLAPRWTPEGVSVSGNVGLDDLRAVFPGY